MRIARLLLVLYSLCVPSRMYSQGVEAPRRDGLFETSTLLELTLLFDIDTLLADLGEDPEYQNALLRYRDPPSGENVEMQIQVRARGNFRKNPENCDFPPLKIKINKEERRGTLFHNNKELKIVTHCQNDQPEFQQYVLQEYLIYRAYNIFTDFSFRVRLARITYLDLPDQKDSIRHFAFLIEDAEDMAERNNCRLLDLETAPKDKLDQLHYARMSVFNYMMINTDYSVPIVHNIELLSMDHFEPPIPVPYDFDWSGMINIPYDSPFANDKTRYPDRRYKGPCLKRKELEAVFTDMVSKREELYALYQDFPYLDDDLKSRSLQEIRLFFITISNRGLVRQEFIKDCD